MPNTSRHSAVTDPYHIQDENGDIVGYVKGNGTEVGYTRPYGVTVTGNKTLDRTDLEMVQDCTAAAVLTIPTDAVLRVFDPSARVVFTLYQATTGAASFAAGAGVNPLRGTAPTIAQYGTMSVMHVGLNEWAYL